MNRYSSMQNEMTRKPIEDSTLVVVGLVRNCADKVEHEIGRLRDATNRFKNVRFLVVESDSDDATLDRLANIKDKFSDTEYLSLGRLRDAIPKRTARIAHCRNRYVDEIAQNPAYSSVDFVAVADLDGVNALLSQGAIQSCWMAPEDWDVVTANQLRAYYDIWPLRHESWCPVDCYVQKRSLSTFCLSHEARRLAVHARQIRLRFDMGLLEVDSAFGGFAIYRREAFLLGRYTGLYESGDELSEHVPFHALLRRRGCRIYINPALINCYEVAMHLEPSEASAAFLHGNRWASLVQRLIRPFFPSALLAIREKRAALRDWNSYLSKALSELRAR